MSNSRLEDRLVADGPGGAVLVHPPAGIDPELLKRGLDHPILAGVLRHLLEREAQAVGRPVAYYEDSP
ncbi:hypothetical protein [Streptomyces apricus]|uniref:Uncharacterized protein n=1 Tax=Streptomyces apricus TaxID=1828112 RepID=A0A5A9ZU92_9ACTN|nr:hypothetical protein [Streptomyces apricus]KAA0920562.1 hypothetical protein FGF04_37680 [Streptomyces apricus]